MAQLDKVAPPAHSGVAGGSPAAFPKVNLLPDQIAEQARVRRAKLVLVGAAAVSAVLIGGLYVMAQSDVANAQEGLDSANAQAATLSAQVATYSDVPKVQAELTAANQAMTTAMGGEVRWSYLLNNLALTIPNNVSLITYKGTLNAASTGTTAAAPATGTSAAAGAPGSDPTAIGNVAYTGESKTYGNVASWMQSQSKQPDFANVYLSTAALTTANGSTNTHQTVQFSSTSDLTTKALSHRYDKTGN